MAAQDRGRVENITSRWMSEGFWLRGLEMNGSGSESCPLALICVSDVDPLGSATTLLVRIIYFLVSHLICPKLKYITIIRSAVYVGVNVVSSSKGMGSGCLRMKCREYLDLRNGQSVLRMTHQLGS
jgi:hypothetical protein